MGTGTDTINLITVLGHTAGGKTRFAACLADRVEGEVISADSRQVYRGMDIGTDKANARAQARVPHHLIDVVEPDDGIIAIGSGGSYALAAARALLRHTDQSAKQIALEAMKIASDICIYTNEQITVEEF